MGTRRVQRSSGDSQVAGASGNSANEENGKYWIPLLTVLVGIVMGTILVGLYFHLSDRLKGLDQAVGKLQGRQDSGEGGQQRLETILNDHTKLLGQVESRLGELKGLQDSGTGNQQRRERSHEDQAKRLRQIEATLALFEDRYKSMYDEFKAHKLRLAGVEIKQPFKTAVVTTRAVKDNQGSTYYYIHVFDANAGTVYTYRRAFRDDQNLNRDKCSIVGEACLLEKGCSYLAELATWSHRTESPLFLPDFVDPHGSVVLRSVKGQDFAEQLKRGGLNYSQRSTVRKLSNFPSLVEELMRPHNRYSQTGKDKPAGTPAYSDSKSLWQTYFSLGSMAREEGRFAEALALFKNGLTVAKESGDASLQAKTQAELLRVGDSPEGVPKAGGRFDLARLDKEVRGARGPGTEAVSESSINRFYQDAVQALKTEGKQAERLAGLIENNRTLAERCLAIIKRKAAEPGEAQQSFRYLAERLQESLWITSKRANCDQESVGKMLDLARKQVDDDDKIFCLQGIARQCPQEGTAHHWLGDVYMKRGQVGMAVVAYKKGLQVKNDENTRVALTKAEQMLSEYQQGKPITVADARHVFGSRLHAPVRGVTGRKIEVRSALATIQIRFDEWSCQIRTDAIPQLQAVGEALKQELQAGREIRVTVEGHTDKRGPLERNLKLSKERAEAIKKYLVQNFQIDPSMVVTEGYGPSRPYSPAEDEAGYALNRRVEFVKTNIPTAQSGL